MNHTFCKDEQPSIPTTVVDLPENAVNELYSVIDAIGFVTYAFLKLRE